MEIDKLLSELELEYWDDFYDDFAVKSIPFGCYCDNREAVKSLNRERPEVFKEIIDTFLKDRKRIRVSTRAILNAIDSSLYNCRIDTKRIKTKEHSLNKLFISENQAIDILLKYNDLMRNPLAFMFDEEGINKYKSVIDSTDGVWIHYAANNLWPIKFTCCTRWFVHAPNITRVRLDWYHPIIWFLLKEWRLHYYINHYKLWQKKQSITRKQPKTSQV